MSVRRLVQTVSPPPGGGRTIDWDGTERRLGFILPTDYKQLVETYGAGNFGDFLHIYQPDTANEYVDLVHQQERALAALRHLRDGSGEHVPFRIDDPPELAAVGRSDNGDVIYWRRRDSDTPDAWTIAVNESRGPGWFEYEGNLTDFLAAALTAEIRVSVFPDDFPDPDSPPTFDPYDIQ